MASDKGQRVTVTIRLRPEEAAALDRVGQELGFERNADTLRYFLRQVLQELIRMGVGDGT